MSVNPLAEIRSKSELILKGVAFIALLSLFLKAIIDIDQAFDTWWYHIPFAARLWNLVPADRYTNFVKEEFRYLGFPLLIEYLSGFLWWATRHVQAGNLVNYFCLILYCVFLQAYFKVPFYLSSLALLAVPLVQIHASTYYVDLPGAVFLSGVVLLTYRLFVLDGNDADTPKDLLLIIILSTMAVNTKFQFIPLVAFVLAIALARIVWIRWKLFRGQEKTLRHLLTLLPTTILGGALIFATPLKNLAIYGNPFYPIRFEVAGIVLNHDIGFYQHAADSVAEVPQVQRWLYSILEVRSPLWNIDQWSPDPSLSRLGGFFGAYVIFNLLLLVYLCWHHRSRASFMAIAVLVIMSAVTALAPQSHELRYYMYWMVSLVSLNLLLLAALERSPKPSRWLNFSSIGIACVAFLLIVIIRTNFAYIAPTFHTLDTHFKYFFDPNILAQIQPDEDVCLINRSQQYRKTFLYAPIFHRDLGYTYSIRAALEPEECGDLRQIEVP